MADQQRTFNEELDLTKDPVQLDILNTSVAEVLPLSDDYSGNIQFDIRNTRDLHYIDLSKIELEVEFALQYQDAANNNRWTNINGDEDHAGLVNNIIHSAFSNVEVKLNNTVVTDSEKTYGYLAYLAKLTGHDAVHLEDTQGRLIGWGKDEAGDMDTTTVKFPTKFGTGTVFSKAISTSSSETLHTFVKSRDYRGNGLGIRRNCFFYKDSNNAWQYKNAVLRDKFMCVPFNQKKFLPYRVNMFITLERTNNDFVTMQDTSSAGTDGKEYHLKIVRAKLYVPFVELNASKFRALEVQKMQVDRKIPLTRMIVLTRPIPSRTVHPIITNLFQGKPFPKRMLVGLVANIAEAGDKTKNPYNFGNWNIRHFQVFKNGVTFPTYPFKPDFAKENYAELYAALFDTLGSRWENLGLSVNYYDYGNGCTLIPFDLTGDRKGAEDDVDHIPEYGEITFDIMFKSGSNELPQVVTSLIVAAEYEDTMIIDGYGNVRCTWKG